MQVFDASSIIHAWDNYPILQFPGLWEWMATQVNNNTFIMPKIAVDEVRQKIPECCDWLEFNNIMQVIPDNAIIQFALHIKNLLGIDGDNYHSGGVGENDIIIIATANIQSSELISDEKQPNPPSLPAKSKIPTVCALPGISVPCFTFIEFIKRTNVVFR